MHFKVIKHRDNTRSHAYCLSLSPPPPPPPHTHTLGTMLATLGELTEFRVSFNGNRGSVTLMFEHKRRKRGLGKKPCAPQAVKGDQNRELNCRPHPSQEFQGRSRGGGGQSLWLNHRGRSRLATGTQLLQPGRPERGLGAGLLILRPHLGRHQLDDRLFTLQLRLSHWLQRRSRRAGGPEEKGAIAVAA